MLQRNLHAFFSLVFLTSAVVQWNDPDWLPWMAIYLAAAWETLLAAFRRHERARALVIALIALAWEIRLMSQARIGEWSWNEVQRESGGILLVALWMIVVWRRASLAAADRDY